MAVEEAQKKDGPASIKGVDVESGSKGQTKDGENHDQAEVVVEKPKKKWFQKRK